MATASRLFVRNSTGLVRSASAVDATIFNAVISAPVGSTIAYSIFFALVAFPGADVVSVLILVAVINIPVLIMFALLGASMPRVGGDYVWVSRVLSPPLALISNLCMIMGGLLGAAFFAKFFSVLALGPGARRAGCDLQQQPLHRLGQRISDQQQLDPRSFAASWSCYRLSSSSAARRRRSAGRTTRSSSRWPAPWSRSSFCSSAARVTSSPTSMRSIRALAAATSLL